MAPILALIAQKVMEQQERNKQVPYGAGAAQNHASVMDFLKNMTFKKEGRMLVGRDNIGSISKKVGSQLSKLKDHFMQDHSFINM